MIRPLFAMLVAVAAWTPLAVQAQDAGNVGTFKLPGGTEVITFEDHAGAWVVVDTFLDVGSASDFEGYPGIAAATAHAVWAGGKQAPGAAIAALGGEGHVVVDRTVTHFQAKLPAAKLDAGMTAIGEAFSHPDWAGLDLAKAFKSFDAAAAQALAAPNEAAFQTYMEASADPAMGHAIYGAPGARFTREDIHAYFDRYYVPARTKVVLTGDFATGKAVGQVVRSYAALLQRQASLGKLPVRPMPAARPAAKPARPLVLVGARGPDIANAREQAAMEILKTVFAGTP
ncbi:MAG: insulinase family protein, partial [Cyanobacteria bacterium RYN_339]|nr:insulinase family protein [Cyanobacteria bacterium RYN_339]